MSNLIDIVIPTKDRPQYVAQAIRSALEQTRGLGKVIVVDDGSSPTIEDSLDPELKPRCTFIRNETSLGVSAARNRGIKEAENDWVVFLDDDDWLSEQFTADLADHLLQAIPNRTFCWPSRVLVSETTGKQTEIKAPFWDGAAHLRTEQLSSMMDTGCSGTAFSRAAFLKVGGFDETLTTSEDRDLVFRLLQGRSIGTPSHRSQIFIRIHDGVRLSNKLGNRSGAKSDLQVISKNRNFLAKHPVLAEKFIGRVAKRLWTMGESEAAISTIDFLCKIKPFSLRHRKRQIWWRVKLKLRKVRL